MFIFTHFPFERKQCKESPKYVVSLSAAFELFFHSSLRFLLLFLRIPFWIYTNFSHMRKAFETKSCYQLSTGEKRKKNGAETNAKQKTTRKFERFSVVESMSRLLLNLRVPLIEFLVAKLGRVSTKSNKMKNTKSRFFRVESWYAYVEIDFGCKCSSLIYAFVITALYWYTATVWFPIL